MVDDPMRSDVDLATLRASLEEPRDALVAVRLVVTGGGAIATSNGVPEPIASEVEATVAAQPVPGDPGDPGDRSTLAAVCDVLRSWNPQLRVEGGPMFVFERVPAAPELPPGVDLVSSGDDSDTAALREARPANWQLDEWAALITGELGPWVIALDDGGAVSAGRRPRHGLGSCGRPVGSCSTAPTPGTSRAGGWRASSVCGCSPGAGPSSLARGL
jgi:hypothetical protein